MNKNPERPEDMDSIISDCVNPKSVPEDKEKHNDTEEEIKSLVFGE